MIFGLFNRLFLKPKRAELPRPAVKRSLRSIIKQKKYKCKLCRCYKYNEYLTYQDLFKRERGNCYKNGKIYCVRSTQVCDDFGFKGLLK